MKILYNITIKIESPLQEEWLTWMKNIHIPDVMATGYFEWYKITKILGDDDEYGLGFAIQYVAFDMESFNRYQTNDAKRLQQDHSDRYQGKYVAFRTLMEIVEEG
ncbi:MAG: DUF4286 family protein [Saprospiraceae bacterium]|nr:DUF4286 family protein [Saprospiraceae bacterium]